MSEQTVVEYCAPTLAGIKTGSLFSYIYKSASERDDDIRKLNSVFFGKGISVVPVGIRNHRTLIYMYRPDFLERDISDGTARKVLSELGYSEFNSACCVRKLVERLEKAEQFPHEIGLFLGYPPEDVIGFIKHKGKKARLTGYYKVYGDKDKALHTFRTYKKCTETYQEQLNKGKTIEDLIVQV